MNDFNILVRKALEFAVKESLENNGLKYVIIVAHHAKGNTVSLNPFLDYLGAFE